MTIVTLLTFCGSRGKITPRVGVVMTDEKQLMFEAATLYYKQNHTQQEIADLLGLSRQTVSRLINDAVREGIVDIKVLNPETERKELSAAITKEFGIKEAVICPVSRDNTLLRQKMTVSSAADYLLPLFKAGGLNIALSWGRTIMALCDEIEVCKTEGNTVFPLFGATDDVDECFLSNALARTLADKISASLKFAWFPYLAENPEDTELFKKTSYYKNIKSLWENIDIAVVGIGNADVLRYFEKNFGYENAPEDVIGDVATHFFSKSGELLDLFENSLCASSTDLKKAKTTVAVAFGDDKAEAIASALKTGLCDVLITDEYTAKAIIKAK